MRVFPWLFFFITNEGGTLCSSVWGGWWGWGGIVRRWGFFFIGRDAALPQEPKLFLTDMPLRVSLPLRLRLKANTRCQDVTQEGAVCGRCRAFVFVWWTALFL